LLTRTVRNSPEGLTLNDKRAVFFVGDGTVIASHYFTVTSFSKTERPVKKEHRRAVEQPHVVKMYNQGMGYRDVCDRILSSYRPRLRSRKWWWNLFSNSLNLLLVAAFGFCSYAIHIKTTHRQFGREIARYLAKAGARIRLGGPAVQHNTAVKYDGVSHALKSASQGRCVF